MVQFSQKYVIQITTFQRTEKIFSGYELSQKTEKGEEVMPPIKRVKGGWKVISYVTKKPLKKVYKTKASAQRKAGTSKRRSKRKRHTGRRY